MFRDRTNLFISYRQSYAHHPAKKRKYASPSSNGFASSSAAGGDEERQGLMSSRPYDDEGDAFIEMDVLPPRWADVQDEVTDLLRGIATKSVELDKLHQKHVLPGFEDEDVKKREEDVIEGLTQEITRSFHKCQAAIKRVESMVREAKSSAGGSSGGITQGEETIARNIQISLAAKVQESSAAFRKRQSNYLKKLRTLGGLTSPALPSSSPPQQQHQNPYANPSLLLDDTEADTSLSRSTLQQTSSTMRQRQQYRTNDTAIAQREREINDIAKGIIELADIFKELQTMVIDQGTMLDRIDYNVENVNVNVKGAEKELKVASTSQRKSLKRKIIFFLFLVVVGLFIILLIKPKRHPQNNNSPVIDTPPKPHAPATPIDPPAEPPPEGGVADAEGMDGKGALFDRGEGKEILQGWRRGRGMGRRRKRRRGRRREGWDRGKGGKG